MPAMENTVSDVYKRQGLLLAGSSLYREACECYAHAIALDPFNGILYRHWAHRMLSQWRFEDVYKRQLISTVCVLRIH